MVFGYSLMYVLFILEIVFLIEDGVKLMVWNERVVLLGFVFIVLVFMCIFFDRFWVNVRFKICIVRDFVEFF